MLICGRAPFPAGLAPEVTRGLAGVVAARLAVNGGIRVVYPFLPVLAHGLGMSFEVLALLIATRSMAGVAGPVLARITPLHRQRALMITSELVVASGCLLIAAAPAAPATIRTAVVGVGFLATGLARPLFDLPMQTWVSTHVPAAERGRALGVTELGWALSLAATVPLAGVLIDHAGWRSLFVLVAAMAAAGIVALLLMLPGDGAPTRAHAMPLARGTTARTWTFTGLAICAGAALAVAASETVLVVYGEWLAQDFGMSVTQIGASTLLIVTAELVGEGLVVTVSDRVGLWRTLFSALAVSAAAYSTLGLAGDHISVAIAAISGLFVALEVTVIMLIAIASTVVQRTQDRARLLGGVMAATACGNAVGAALAPLLFARGGIALSGMASACAIAVAAAVLWSGSQQRARRLRADGDDSAVRPQGRAAIPEGDPRPEIRRTPDAPGVSSSIRSAHGERRAGWSPRHDVAAAGGARDATATELVMDAAVPGDRPVHGPRGAGEVVHAAPSPSPGRGPPNCCDAGLAPCGAVT